MRTPTPHKPIERKCMRCHRYFISKHFGNRLCSNNHCVEERHRDAMNDAWHLKQSTISANLDEFQILTEQPESLGPLADKPLY